MDNSGIWWLDADTVKYWDTDLRSVAISSDSVLRAMAALSAPVEVKLF